MKEQIIYLDINKLKPYENNPRYNEDAVEKVAESIKQYGFRNPIILDKNNVIIAGHTRLEASKKLGLHEVPCIYADDLSDEEVKAFRLADNKVSDYSIWDNKKLIDELEDLKEFDLFTGFEISEYFDDRSLDDLEPEINEVLDDNDKGVYYKIEATTSDKNIVDKIKELFNYE